MASSRWCLLATSLFATPTRNSRRLRLSAGLLAGLVHLHLGVGHHQPALVRERDQLEAHVDGAHSAVGAGAVDARIEAALAAFLDDLLVDRENLRLGSIEFWFKSIGEAEIGRADIDAIDALDIEDSFHVLDRGLGLHH